MNIFELFGTIAIQNKDANKAIDETGEKANGLASTMEKAFSKIGSIAKTVGKTAVAGLAASTAAMGALMKKSIGNYADYEQLVGGVQTLFGDDVAKTVMDNAQKAFQTAGMSANAYMETVTGFSASLVASLKGDTVKAADAADMALRDMSDNANKMGTDMTLIQNAYQGFAKQNYTMLDNLKLGYGGTKTEMERLLSDAQKISGVKYDINNLSDVYSAIHVIQGELDITGTTAKEAASTISGSFSSMKSAFKNVMGEIALGMDIGPSMQALGETVTTFLAGNLIPAIGNILSGLPNLINGMISIAVRNLNIASNNADVLVYQGAQIIGNLATGLITNIPYIADAAIRLITSFGSALLNADWVGMTQELIWNIQSGLNLASGEILGSDESIFNAIRNAIQTKLPEILDNGVEIITSIANGILQNLPMLITTAGDLLTEFVSTIIQMLPMVLSAGSKLLLKLVNGIINNLPQIVSAVVKVIAKFIATVGQNLPQILQSGITIIGKLAAGLIQAIPTLIGKIPQIITSVKNAFVNTDWLSIGNNIISGIANGLSNAGWQLWDSVKGVLGNFKDKVLSFFGIHSPSKWGIWVGEMIDSGVGNGVSGGAGVVRKAVDSLISTVSSPFEASISYGANIGNQIYKENSNGTILEKINVLITLLRSLVNSDKEAIMMLNDREVGRALKEIGVVFE